MAPPLRMAPRRLPVASGSGRLQPQHTGRSNKRADSFYLSPEWRAFRDQLVKERGWRCEDTACQTPHGSWKQIYGDHIIEITDGGEKLDRSNVLLRCGACHGRKTRDEKARRAGWFDPLSGGGIQKN